MNEQAKRDKTTDAPSRTGARRGLLAVAALALLAAAPAARANYVQVNNVSLESGGKVQFDLSWSNSWRQVWGGGAYTNWDAAWVFVKFRKVGANGYSHATLSTTAGHHAVPSDAALDVGLTAGRTPGEGVGVFIYRNAADWVGDAGYNGVQLKWLQEADGVAVGENVDIQVHAIEMVYVPEGEFRVGTGVDEAGSFKNGSSAGSFLVNATWSGPGGTGTARQIGNAAGKLWGNSTSGNNTIGPEGALNDKYPTGYSAFYCMKYEITQGQYAKFLNALTSAEAVQHYYNATPGNRYSLTGSWPNITAGKPYVACNYLSWADVAAYKAWAGLRPMTELEFEKACRGPLAPVAGEFAWGSISIHASQYTLSSDGMENESVDASTTAGNAVYSTTVPGSGTTQGPLRAGVFATATSGRAAAGASYWGIMELSGNLWTRAVGVAANSGDGTGGRQFQGTHGTGTAALPADWPQSDAIGVGSRGGSWAGASDFARVSDRPLAARVLADRMSGSGSRAVRSAPPQ